MNFFQNGLFEPAWKLILCKKVVNQKADPTCHKKDNNGDEFTSKADIHFEDFQNCLDTEDDTNDVDDFCDHNSVILRLVICA